MPLLGLFAKKEKQKYSEDALNRITSYASEHSVAESEYVIPDANIPISRNGTAMHDDPPAASSSKLKIPPLRRKGQSSSQDGLSARSGKSIDFSSGASEASPGLLQVPPDKRSLFGAYGDSQGTRSTRSLPSGPTHARKRSDGSAYLSESMSSPDSSTSPSKPAKKSGGLFSWAHRDRTKSKPPKPSETLPAPTPESFNLKSFRHVGIPSPTTSPRPSSPASSIIPPPTRPRGNSVASDSSQRISVAAFREAQARRSAAGSPSPSLRPPSALDAPIGTRPGPSTSPRMTSQPAVPTRQRPAPTAPRRSTGPVVSSRSTTSDESESESSESDDEPSHRPGRQRTITQRSAARAQSELGHRLKVPDSNDDTIKPSRSNGSANGSSPQPSASASHVPDASHPSGSFARTRASASTSALQPNAAAQRASAVLTANVAAAKPSGSAFSTHRRVPARAHDSDSGTSDDSDDSDDAPLSSLVNPKRPGTSMSATSTGSKKPAKPLIDIKSLGGVPSLSSRQDEDKADTPPTTASPSNLNERLANLTRGTGSKSAENLLTSSPIDMETKPSPSPRIPVRRETEPLPAHTDDKGVEKSEPRKRPLKETVIIPGARSSSLMHTPAFISSPETDTHAETKRFVPIPVKERTAPPSFAVTSRPASQAHSRTNSQSAPPDAPSASPASTSTARMTSVSSSSTASTARPQTLVSLIPPGSGMNDSTPKRPFVSSNSDLGRSSGLRGNSPASSTGDSSSGRAPYTPRDGSDIGYDKEFWENKSNVSSSVSSGPVPARGHKKSSSVTFEDQADSRGRVKGVGGPRDKGRDEESRRRERRRTEAKAAMELGNVMNGRGPIATEDDGDEDSDNSRGTQNMGPRMNMMNPMMGMNGMNGMNFGSMPPPMGWAPWQQPMPTSHGPMPMPNAQQFMVPPAPPNADSGFMAAHHQAMMIAKQAYMTAVAQQAMAAAGDEWERGSAYGGSQYGGSTYGGSSMSSYGMPWGAQSMMFSGSRSTYASSVAGDSVSEAGWGSKSVYGESFGPSSASRSSMMYASGPAPGPMPGQFGASASANHLAPPQQQRRPRTKSSPGDVNPGVPTKPTKKAMPPSSWSPRYQTALRDGT